MTIAYQCVLAAVLMPYIYTILVKSGHGYNHKHCREYIEHLKGWRKRAYWAEVNSFEALPGFIAGVLIATQAGATEIAIDKLALGFIAARILHGICYLCDLAILRTLAWTLGIICVIGLFILAT